MTKVYFHPRCTTCKKAAAFLDANDIRCSRVDITEQPPSRKELEQMLGYLDGNLRKLFNTSGMQYRDLKIKERLPEMSEHEALALLAENGMLVKRPFLLHDKGGLVGFREAQWREALL